MSVEHEWDGIFPGELPGERHRRLVLEEEARKARKIDRDRSELFEGMVRSKAWQEYVSLLNSKVQECGDLLLAPLDSLDKTLAQEHLKGTMKGIMIARDLPDSVIAQHRMEQGNGQDAEEDDAM